MGAKPWARTLACGFICGIVWALLGAVLVGIVGGEFLAAASRGHLSALTSQDHALMFGLTVAAGLWAMWLYSSCFAVLCHSPSDNSLKRSTSRARSLT